MIRSTVAHVDLAALQANFRAIQEFVGVPRIIAVVKANAYGHGSARVGLALEQAGATMLACADIEEGIVIRQAGVRVPILVFGALSVSDLDGLKAALLAAAQGHEPTMIVFGDDVRDEAVRVVSGS